MDIASHGRRERMIRCLIQLCRSINDLEDPLRAGQGSLDVVVHVCQLAKRLDEVLSIGDECGDHPDRHEVLQGQVAAQAASAWFRLPLRGLAWVQCIALAIIGIIVWRVLDKMHGHKLPGGRGNLEKSAEYFHKLVRFVPVGLAIGIMSPVSMLLVRGILSGPLTWSDVGFLQALWRSTEWVTATAAGVLSLIFLPRFSATYGSARFTCEMIHAGMMVLVPAACLLLLIFFNQRFILSMLYDARFAVSNQTAAFIMLGSWVRIVSWVYLFGLFSAHRTGLIIAGEVLSLPLYALLLWLFSDGMTLERTALLYFFSYLAYLAFNAVALKYSLRNSTIIRLKPDDEFKLTLG